MAMSVMGSRMYIGLGEGIRNTTEALAESCYLDEGLGGRLTTKGRWLGG